MRPSTFQVNSTKGELSEVSGPHQPLPCGTAPTRWAPRGRLGQRGDVGTSAGGGHDLLSRASGNVVVSLRPCRKGGCEGGGAAALAAAVTTVVAAASPSTHTADSLAQGGGDPADAPTLRPGCPGSAAGGQACSSGPWVQPRGRRRLPLAFKMSLAFQRELARPCVSRRRAGTVTQEGGQAGTSGAGRGRVWLWFAGRTWGPGSLQESATQRARTPTTGPSSGRHTGPPEPSKASPYVPMGSSTPSLCASHATLRLERLDPT